MMLLSDPPIGLPRAEAVMARASSENFPVASRLLPRRVRAHLLAVYGFARLIDEVGDTARAPAQRLAALDWLEQDLDRAFGARARHPLIVRLQPTLRECALPRGAFARLIEANRVDQRTARYETWEQLRAYCALSADPVGEIVLYVLGKATPARIERSDSICTALQLAEHCQDVAEDLAIGRVYLPVEDLARFMAPAQIASLMACAQAKTRPSASALRELAGLRAAIAFEVARARELLDAGSSLINDFHGRERVALAAFAAGASAALEAIERAGYEVLSGAPRATRARRALALAALLAQGTAKSSEPAPGRA